MGAAAGRWLLVAVAWSVLSVGAGCGKGKDAASPGGEAKALGGNAAPAQGTQGAKGAGLGDKDAGATRDAGPKKPPAKPAREPIPTTPPPDLSAGFTKPPAGAHKGKSGVVWKTLRPGAGQATPKPDDRVTFHYVTWDPTGAVKGNSQRKGEPKEMRVRKMLSGWREVLEGMRVGERRRAWLPAKMAHPRSRKRLSDLDRRVLDLELLSIAPAPPAPKDVRRPPKGAQRTASGLAYEVLREGPKGARGVREHGQVTVRYAGWTTDGRCFDFTGPGETATFGVDGVIAAWTEGLQLMRVGDKVRFWIPQELAYKGKPGKPKGMLVFDIELVSASAKP